MITVSAELEDHKISDKVIVLNVVVGYTVVSGLLHFQLNQVVVSALLGLIIQGGFILLLLLWASWDLLSNPWVKNLHLDKWNFFTTGHYSTWLLHKNENLWLRQQLYIGIPMSTAFGAMILDLFRGVTSLFVNIAISVILLVIVWQTKANKQSSRIPDTDKNADLTLSR